MLNWQMIARWLQVLSDSQNINVEILEIIHYLDDFIKRFTYIPQVYLGIAFGWAIPMAFAAQTGSVGVEAGLLYLATILWAVAYDTIYAMVDRDDDLAIGVKSTAILFGERRISYSQHKQPKKGAHLLVMKNRYQNLECTQH